MKKIILFTFLISIIMFTSCEKSDGLWDDCIKLSAKSVDFNANGGDFTVTSKGTFWLLGTSKPYQAAPLFDVPVENRTTTPYQITGEWYTINRPQEKILTIHIDPNTTGKKRIIYVNLEMGDYFDNIRINQAEK